MRVIRRHIATSVLLALSLSACATNETMVPLEDVCTEPRPKMCTRDYRPVCAVHNDGTQKTQSNGCGACSDETVKGYNRGACAEE